MNTRAALFLLAIAVAMLAAVCAFAFTISSNTGRWVLLAIVAASLLVGGLFKLRDSLRGWRIRSEALLLRYEEKIGNAWVGIPIELELHGHSPVALHYRSVAAW